MAAPTIPPNNHVNPSRRNVGLFWRITPRELRAQWAKDYKVKHTCQHCHFLAKEERPHSFSLSKAERENIVNIVPHYSLKCWMGVWDEGVAPHPAGREETILRVKRNDKCFFWPHQPNMLFKAAEVLQKREAEYEKMKRSNLNI